MLVHIDKNKKKISYHKKIRNFMCMLLSLSFMLSAIVSADTGAEPNGGFADSTESGAAITVETPVEDNETAPPQEEEADVVEDVETEITTSYRDESETEEEDDYEKVLYAQADGKYAITVRYDKDAGIPNGAELNVTEVRSDNYISETADTLGWTDEDYILYTKFFDISIVKDGVEIEPKSPVSVTAELLDVEEEAEALQVVHFDNNGAEEVESQPTDEAEVTFETESFSVYGFGTALRTVMSEKNDFVDISLYSSWEDLEFADRSAVFASPEEGIEPSKAFELSGSVQTSKLWVKAALSENAPLGEDESFALYSVKNNELGEKILDDIADGGELCPVGEDVSGVVLMKDTGLRRQNFDLTQENGAVVSLDGLMPKNAQAKAVDVKANCDENTVAAYDITISNGAKEYQPTQNAPIHVEITDPAIPESGIELWHIKDNGEREQITEFKTEKGKINFEAEGFSTYEIVGLPNSSGETELGWQIIETLEDLREYAKNGKELYIGTNRNDTNLKSKFLSYNIKADTDTYGLTKTSSYYTITNGMKREEFTGTNESPNPAAVFKLVDIAYNDKIYNNNNIVDGIKCHIMVSDNDNNWKYLRHPEEDYLEGQVDGTSKNALLLTEEQADATWFAIINHNNYKPYNKKNIFNKNIR